MNILARVIVAVVISSAVLAAMPILVTAQQGSQGSLAGTIKDPEGASVSGKSYRGISWGIDGAGRGVTLRYRYKF